MSYPNVPDGLIPRAIDAYGSVDNIATMSSHKIAREFDVDLDDAKALIDAASDDSLNEMGGFQTGNEVPTQSTDLSGVEVPDSVAGWTRTQLDDDLVSWVTPSRYQVRVVGNGPSVMGQVPNSKTDFRNTSRITQRKRLVGQTDSTQDAVDRAVGWMRDHAVDWDDDKDDLTNVPGLSPRREEFLYLKYDIESYTSLHAKAVNDPLWFVRLITGSTVWNAKRYLDELVESPDSEAFLQQYASRGRPYQNEFRERVIDAYDATCAFCGRRATEVDGSIEAAHIRPYSHNGPPHVRNGLALCQPHHRAFDAGEWSLKDDYTVLLAANCSDELQAAAPDKIALPYDDADAPSPEFLQHHRTTHGFD